jgi:hypothetical protein
LIEYPEYRILINAVINNIGMDSVRDVNNHGIDGGYSGFVYCSDTHKFAMRYRKQIIAMLEDSASSLGEEIISMVNSFGVFRPDGMDSDDKKDLYKYLGGGRPDQGALTNVMAWFAAEEVCRLFDN